MAAIVFRSALMTATPREFEIVAECCRWPVLRDSPFPLSADDRVDWARVARIAKRHRVEALVWNRLRLAATLVPEEPARVLKVAAERTARANLRAARECLRLKAAFDDAAISVLFVKGVTLAVLAYGTLSLKAGLDIDILIEPDQLEAAAAVLNRAGYICVLPEAVEAGRLRTWHRFCKESVWRNRVTGALLDLHTSLVDTPLLLPAVGLEARQWVELGDGRALPTLPADELFAYLCVHGASSAWFRLKWLADLAALVAPLSSDELERLYGRALELGAGRSAAVALLLCARVLDLQIPDRLRTELRREWVARAIARAALRKMTGRYLESEILSFRWGTLSIQLMQPFLLPKWRFTLSEIQRLMARPEDRLKLCRAESASNFLTVGLLLHKMARPFRNRERCPKPHSGARVQ